MRILILIILLLVALVGYLVYRVMIPKNPTNDPRPAWIRRNHADMARQLERMLVEHNAGTLFLPPGSHEDIEKLTNKYNEHIL